jgi:Ser-tRNA(Ala) deacylase AlaX
VCRCRESSFGKKREACWELTLEGSPLYPEGGGQPSDRGQIRVTGSDTVVSGPQDRC